MFDVWGFDAATVNVYTGGESLEPFFGYRDRGVFVLCRSSNEGAGELQDLALAGAGEGRTLYEWVAMRAVKWNVAGNVGLVVGATYPQELARVRELAPGVPILAPGVGAQSGRLEDAVRSGLDGDHPNLLISSSRGIAYASRRPRDFRDAAREAALRLKERIERVLLRESRGRGRSVSHGRHGEAEEAAPLRGVRVGGRSARRRYRNPVLRLPTPSSDAEVDAGEEVEGGVATGGLTPPFARLGHPALR